MTPAAAPPDETDSGADEVAERRFARYDATHRRRRTKNNETNPDEETIFPGLRTLQAWEVGLFLAAMIASLVVWVIFLWVHRVSPSG